jgi:hypothetical protein
MTSGDTLVAMLAVVASSPNSLFLKGKWRLETACAARDDGSRSFSEGLFRILGLRFCRCVKKEQNRLRGPLILPELGGLLRFAETGGEERSTEIDPGISSGREHRALAELQCRHRQFVSPFGTTAIIASLPLLASFRARAEPVVLTRKAIRIIYRNPSASRPLPSKTDRDTNLEGFFWRCL